MRTTNEIALTRRRLLRSALSCGALAGMISPSSRVSAQGTSQEGKREPAPNLALGLAEMVNRIQYEDLPPAAVKHAKMLIASTLASAASGSLIGSSRIVLELEKERGGRPDATVWFDGTKLPVPAVARINAMFSDAAASDDSDLRNVAHTGTTLAAIGLAIAERRGGTGRDVLSAIAAGYEAAGRIGDALSGGRAGFHASVIVAFGGAAAAARLLGLTDEQTAHAIGITATTMGGLQIGTNSWAREYHAGNAALCAVNAALAAARGYTVNDDMLEARGGFLSVFGGGKVDASSVTRKPGAEWDIVRYMAIKLLPGAHAFHSSTEAAVNAARQAGVSLEEVAKILVSGSQSRSAAGTERPPKDMIEAIHSLRYFVASAVADKEFSWAHATPEKIHNPAVTRLIGLVEPDPAPPSIRYEWSWGGAVTIVTKSGARFTGSVDAPRGSGPRGIEWSDVDAKFRALMPDSHLPARRSEEILKIIHNFDEVKHAADFTRLLR
jgi:2-methylcitrate dehydratase PrpD